MESRNEPSVDGPRKVSKKAVLLGVVGAGFLALEINPPISHDDSTEIDRLNPNSGESARNDTERPSLEDAIHGSGFNPAVSGFIKRTRQEIEQYQQEQTLRDTATRKRVEFDAAVLPVLAQLPGFDQSLAPQHEDALRRLDVDEQIRLDRVAQQRQISYAYENSYADTKFAGRVFSYKGNPIAVIDTFDPESNTVEVWGWLTRNALPNGESRIALSQLADAIRDLIELEEFQNAHRDQRVP